MIKSGFMVKIIKHSLLLFFLTISHNLFAQIDSSFLSKGKINEEDYWDKLRISFYMDSTYNASNDFQFYFNSGLKKIRLNEYSKAIHDFRITLSILNNTKIQKEDTTITNLPYPLFYIGICKSQLGEVDSATYYYKKCIAINKSAIESYNELGAISLNKGQIDTALTYFYKGYEKDKKNIATNYNIGYTSYLKGDFVTAKKYLKYTIEQNPHFDMPYILLGNISSKVNNLDRANDYYSSAINANPLATSGYYYRGICYLFQKEESKAYLDFIKVYALDTLNYQTLYLLGALDILSNRFELGVSRLTKYLSSPKDRSKQRQLDDYKDIEFKSILNILCKGDLSSDERDLGYQFLKNAFSNNWVINKENTLKFLSVNKESLFAKRLYLLSLAEINFCFSIVFLDDFDTKDSTLTMVSFIKGKLFFEMQQYPKSIEYFSKAISNPIYYANALYYRGLAYCYNHDDRLAINDFSKLILMYPSCSLAYNGRGYSFEQINKHREAVNDYLKSIKINPHFAWTFDGLACSYKNLNMYDSTIYYSSISIDLDPYYHFPYYNRGFAYDKINQFDKAVADLNIALELQPNWFIALSLRGDLFLKTYNYVNAITDLTKCINMNPLEIDTYYEKRGNAFFLSKDYDNAINDFQKLININNKDQFAYLGIGKCHQEKRDFMIAIKYYDLAISKDSSLSIAYYQKGLCFSSTDKSEQAILNYKKAINIDSTYSLPFSSLSREYYITGNYNKSIMFSQKAVELNKSDLDAMFIIALSNLRLNNFNVAKRQYQLFKKLGIKQGKQINQNTINDLKELIEKGIYVDESKEILKDIFDIQI